MMKLRDVGALYKDLAEFEYGGHSRLLGVNPQNVAFGYDVGNISGCCLVYSC